MLLYEISRHVQKSFAVLPNHVAACRVLLLVLEGFILCGRSLCTGRFRSGAALSAMVMIGSLAGKLCNREDAVDEFLVFKHGCV